MTPTNTPFPETLQTLHQLAQNICGAARDLSAHAATLDPEQLKHITDSSNTVLQAVEASGAGGAPIEDKEVRHDIRNQLAVIRGFSDLMQMEGSPDQPTWPALESLVKNCDEMTVLLDSYSAN